LKIEREIVGRSTIIPETQSENEKVSGLLSDRRFGFTNTLRPIRAMLSV
jgi:hypothetical protein